MHILCIHKQVSWASPSSTEAFNHEPSLSALPLTLSLSVFTSQIRPFYDRYQFNANQKPHCLDPSSRQLVLVKADLDFLKMFYRQTNFMKFQLESLRMIYEFHDFCSMTYFGQVQFNIVNFLGWKLHKEFHEVLILKNRNLIQSPCISNSITS